MCANGARAYIVFFVWEGVVYVVGGCADRSIAWTLALMSAPSSVSTRTVSSLPFAAAKWSGVRPYILAHTSRNVNYSVERYTRVFARACAVPVHMPPIPRIVCAARQNHTLTFLPPCNPDTNT